jgi:hypothetical protein
MLKAKEMPEEIMLFRCLFNTELKQTVLREILSIFILFDNLMKMNHSSIRNILLMKKY